MTEENHNVRIFRYTIRNTGRRFYRSRRVPCFPQEAIWTNKNKIKEIKMSREDYQIIMQRYETYCHAFISIAGQVKHIEDTHGLDLTQTKNTMWALLEQIVLDKPDWSR